MFDINEYINRVIKIGNNLICLKKRGEEFYFNFALTKKNFITLASDEANLKETIFGYVNSLPFVNIDVLNKQVSLSVGTPTAKYMLTIEGYISLEINFYNKLIKIDDTLENNGLW